MKISLNMRTKIFLLALLANLIVISIISILFYKQSADFFDEQYAKSLSERLYIGTKNVDKAFKNVYLKTIEISFDRQIKELINYDDIDDFKQISSILRSAYQKDDLIDNIYCYIPSTHVLIRANEYNNVRILSEDIAEKWTQSINKQEGMQPLFISDIFSSSTKSVYLYKSEIKNDSGDIVGYIVCTINERTLYYNYLDDIVRNGNSIICLFDDTGHIVSTNKYIENVDSKNLYDVIEQNILGQVDLQIANESYLGVYNIAPFSKYAFYLAVNKNLLMTKLFLVQVLIILVGLIILFISSIIIYLITLKLNKPIENLAKAMQKVGEGDLSIRAKVYNRDEIGKLAVVFNYMISRINRLVDDLANEKVKKKEAELNALQYQIRPHFIYNTLNAIRFAALMQGAKNIGNLLENFINLLQVSTNRKGAFATVEEEMATLKNYISLQEFRMMDTFKADFDVDEQTLKYYVPRLILQPLVENSIIHGPSEKRNFCNIMIRSYVKESFLYLEVEDDGKGMTAKQMERFIDFTKKTSGGYSSIGVFNIKERLRLYYGEKAALLYFSDGKTFTRARIRLPISVDINEYKL